MPEVRTHCFECGVSTKDTQCVAYSLVDALLKLTGFLPATSISFGRGSEGLGPL